MQSGRRHRSNPARSLLQPDSKKRARVESLERRQLLSTVVVNTIADSTDSSGSSTVSLRDALATANVATTPTTITFSPTVFASAQTIILGGTELTAGANDQTVTIVGPTAGLTINANNLSRVMYIPQGGTVSVSNVSFINGNANGDSGGVGGGIYSQGSLTLTDDTVSGNTAQGDGGGIESSISNTSSAALTLTNVTITLNNSGSNQGNGGGGLHTDGAATLRDVTITDNTAVNSGGGISVGSTPISIGNSVVAGNTASVGPDVGGLVVSAGHNLIGESDVSSGWIGTDILGSIADPVNPLLSPLAFVGGGTPTQLPETSSPLIDQGSNAIIPAGITTDQRGLTRIYNSTVDIGAVETQPQIVVTAPAPETTSLLQNRTFNIGSFVESTSNGPFNVSVNWGDGTLATTFTTDSSGVIPGHAHTYSTSGTDTATVTVTDASGTISGSASFQITVLNADIIVTPPAAEAAVAGRVATLTLGSFSGTNTTAPYAVDVYWGDGTTDSIFTASSTGTLPSLTHTFPTAGTDHVTVTVTDAGGYIANSGTFTANVSPVNVVIIPPSNQNALVSVSTPFQLGSFTESNATAPFTVAVAWGDGSTVTPVTGVSAGAITPEAHTYVGAGIYTATIVVFDNTGLVKGSATFQISVTTGTVQSSTTLATSATTFAAGTSVTLTATVSPSVATGTVDFIESGTLLGSAVVTNGVATYTTTTLGQGSYAITANYLGDATYASSSSSVVDLFVTPPPTSTTLTLNASLSAADASQFVTLTAVVSPSLINTTTAATGTVTYYLDSTYFATAPVGPGGVATYTTTSPLPLGTDLMTASYSGDTYFASSVATAVPVVVTQAPTKVVLSSNVHSKTVAQFVTFTATVGPEFDTPSTFTHIAPTGTVSFSEDGVVFGTAPVASNGNATLSVNGLPVGLDLITATYSGDTLFASALPGSEDLAVTQHALVPTITAENIPASLVAGTHATGSVKVNLTNELSDFEKTTETGYFSVRVFAAPTTTLDASVDPVLGYTVRRGTILEGRTIKVNVPFSSLPASTPAGTYHLLLESTDSAGNTEIVDTGATLPVIAPVVALTMAFSSNSTNILAAGAALVITNSGNVNYTTSFTPTVGFTTDAAGQNSVGTGVARISPRRLTIRAGSSVTVHVTGWNQLLATLPAGTYYFTAKLTDASGKTLFAVSPLTT